MSESRGGEQVDDGTHRGRTGRVSAAAPPGHDALIRAQAETLAAARRQYGVLARILFATLDALYGKTRTLSKFKVLELIARVPYQSWEQVAYIAITHMHSRTGLARRIYDRVRESREQQDNEQWHLLILEELIARSGKRENHLLLLDSAGNRICILSDFLVAVCGQACVVPPAQRGLRRPRRA